MEHFNQYIQRVSNPIFNEDILFPKENDNSSIVTSYNGDDEYTDEQADNEDFFAAGGSLQPSPLNNIPFNIYSQPSNINNVQSYLNNQANTANTDYINNIGQYNGNLKNTLSESQKINALASNYGSVASMATDAVGTVLSGGNSTNAGNVMNGLGNVAAMIPGPYGAIASVALKGLGHLTNAAFGSNINKAFVNNTNQGIASQNSMNSNAKDADQLLNDANNMNYMANVSKKDVGTEGWFNNKASRITDNLNTKINDANNRTYNNLQNASNNVDQTLYNKLNQNYAAYGGSLFANGGPLKKIGINQVADNSTLYTKLPDETDSDKSITHHAYLPTVSVYGRKPVIESENKPMEGLPFLNAATLGLANNLSMSHNIGVLKDIVNSDKSWMDVFNSQVNGNNGVVSDEYAKNNPIKSNLINFALDMLSPSILKGGDRAYKIARNIKNRNLIAFNTIEPFSYQGAYQRGGDYLKALLTTEELPKFNKLEGKMSEWYYNGDYRVKNRAGAWRKYLQIPDEQYGDVDIYNINPDGKTWHYNKKALDAANKRPYIHKGISEAKDGKMVTTDFITGNGGNVQVDLKTIKDYAGNPLYRKGIMTDTWDIQPFQNAWASKPFENLIRSAAEKANMNYHMDIGNNRLSNILKLRKLKDWGRGKLNDWSNESPKFIQFLDNIVFPKIKDLEMEI